MFNKFFSKENLAHIRNPFMDTFLDNEPDSDCKRDYGNYDNEDEEKGNV